MPDTAFDKLGAVLVIERLRCRGKRINELGELEPCGSVHDRPAKKLAQLYRTPLDRSAYSIEMIKEAQSVLGEYQVEQPIIGKHRVIYIQESYCDWCQICFRENITWDQVHKLPIEARKADTMKLETPQAYADACSHRDKLRNDLEAAREAARKAVDERDRLRDQYHLACDTVHACSRYYYNKAQKQWTERPSVKLNTSAKRTPMTLDDI